MGEWLENPLVDGVVSRDSFSQLGVATGDNAHWQRIFDISKSPAYCSLSVPDLSRTITKSTIQQDTSSSNYGRDTPNSTPTESRTSLRKPYQAILTHPIPNPNILDLHTTLPRSLAGGDQRTQKVATTTTSRSTTKLSSSSHLKRPIRVDDKDEESSNPYKRRKESDQSITHKDPSARRGSLRKLEYACPFYRNNPDDPGLRENCRTRGINTDKLKEHIRRKHTRPAQCTRCGYRGERGCIAKHKERDTCRRSANIKKVDARTLEKDDKLREARGQSWHHIFEILFPNSPPPGEDEQWFHEEDEHDRRCLLDALASFLERTFPELIKSFRDSGEFKKIKNPNIESIMQTSLNPIAEATRLVGALPATFSGFNPSPSTTQNSESTTGSAYMLDSISNLGSTPTPCSATPNSPAALSSELILSPTPITCIAATAGDNLCGPEVRDVDGSKSRVEEDLNIPFRFQAQDKAGSTNVGLGSAGAGKELQICPYVIPGRGYPNSGVPASASKFSIASSSGTSDCFNQTRDLPAETIPTMTIKNGVSMTSVGKEVVELATSKTNKEAWEADYIQLYETRLAATGGELDSPFSMFQSCLEFFLNGL